MAGWVKLHRDFLDSPEFESMTINQQLIFIKLLARTNYEDGIWTDRKKGIEVKIKRGQIVISGNKIADEWFKNKKNLTKSITKQALKTFEKLNFLTKQAYNDYTIYTLTDYCVSQARENDNNQALNQAVSESSPSTPENLTKHLTTIKEREELKELKDSNKKIRPKVAPSDTDLENAHLLYEKILTNLPNYKKPNFVTWGNAFRLLREQDNIVNDKEIKFLINFAQEHKFWKKNILSAVSFRDKYNTLYLEAKDAGDKRRYSAQKPGISEAEEYVERLKKEQAQKQGAIEIG